MPAHSIEYSPLVWLVIGAAFAAVVILLVVEDLRDRQRQERQAAERRAAMAEPWWYPQ